MKLSAGVAYNTRQEVILRFPVNGPACAGTRVQYEYRMVLVDTKGAEDLGVRLITHCIHRCGSTGGLLWSRTVEVLVNSVYYKRLGCCSTGTVFAWKQIWKVLFFFFF